MAFQVWLLAFSLIGPYASAQIDPTSAILLRGGSQAPDKGQLDRGRYTIKPGDNRPVTAPNVAAPVTKLPPKIEPKKPASKVETVAPTSDDPPIVVSPVDTTPPGVTEKVRDAVLGGSPEEVENYLGRVHDQDPRQNLIDLSVAPMYFYLNSSSNYWYRSYSASGPGFNVGARVWASPFFGVTASFANSMESSIYTQPASRDRLAIDFTWFEAGLRWRNYFGLSRKSSMVALGIDFAEIQTRVPPNATDRIRTKTSGVKLSLEVLMPKDHEFAWQFGGFIMPRAEHAEGATAIAVKSGSKDETAVVGVSLGGLHTLNRHNQIFWRLSHQIERTFFKGTASTADPVTGGTPSGVFVTTGTSFFTFGYRWGN